MDDDRRKLYDETGETEDNDIDINNTYQFYRNIYPTITKEDIEIFSENYRKSEMEIDDLIKYYKENNGDMTYILHWIPLSENQDIPRYLKIYEDLFKNKKLAKTKKYSTTKNKIKHIQEDSKEVIEENSKKFDDLCKQIKAKKTKRDDLFENLSMYILDIRKKLL